MDTFSSRNILDFYFLEAMTDRAKRLPEAPLPSQEKWKSDLERLYEPFVKGFAASVRDYLFLSCMGEARHGYEFGGAHFPELGNAYSRSEAYRQSVAFSPEKRNISKLTIMFNEYTWGEPGYGGTPWGAVAAAIKLYGQVPDAVFVDLVVSIEHNNGNVFDKEVSNVIAFECDMGLHNRLKSFLDYKARQDVLSHPDYLKWLSRETLTLLGRYYHVVSRKDAPRDIQMYLARRPPRLPKEYESPWGNKVLGQLELSPEREDEYDEEEIQTEEIYDEYNISVSATPKMPRG